MKKHTFVTFLFCLVLTALIVVLPANTSAACDPLETSETGVTNLITNSGFETDTTGYGTIGGPTLTSVNTQFYSGCRSLEVSNRNFSYEGPSVDLQTLLTNNQVYRFSTWVLLPDLETATLIATLKITDANGTTYTRIDSKLLQDGNWQKLIGYFEYNVTAPVTEAVIYIEQNDTETVVPIFYVDEVYLELIPAQQTYYIDSALGDDENSGRSESTAWQTTANITNFPFRAGDTISFKSGSQFDLQNPLVFSRSGTSELPITLNLYSAGDKPNFDNKDAANIEDIFRITGSNYQINNLSFTNTELGNITESAIRVSGSNVLIDDIFISGTGFGVTLAGGSNLEVTNSTIRDLIMIANTDDSGDNDYGAIAVNLQGGSNILVSDNEFYNIGAASFDYGLDGALIETFGAVTNVVFKNNFAIGGESLMEIGSNVSTDVTTNIKAHHNILIDFRSPIGAFHNNPAASFGQEINGVYIENNTFVKSTADSAGFVIGFDLAPTANTFFIRNNIFKISNVSNWALNSGDFNSQYNIYDVSNIGNMGFTYDSSEFSSSITFLNTSANNYRLLPESEAIDAGVDLGYTTDFYEVSLPQGLAFDIGAAEYLAAASSSSTSSFSSASATSFNSSSSASATSSATNINSSASSNRLFSQSSSSQNSITTSLTLSSSISSLSSLSLSHTSSTTSNIAINVTANTSNSSTTNFIFILIAITAVGLTGWWVLGRLSSKKTTQ